MPGKLTIAAVKQITWIFTCKVNRRELVHAAVRRERIELRSAGGIDVVIHQQRIKSTICSWWQSLLTVVVIPVSSVKYWPVIGK